VQPSAPPILVVDVRSRVLSTDPPTYSDIDEEGLVIPNFSVQDPTFSSLPPPSYDEVMAESFKP
jgi:hypothetical protein